MMVMVIDGDSGGAAGDVLMVMVVLAGGLVVAGRLDSGGRGLNVT
jgi:hypothetical protein